MDSGTTHSLPCDSSLRTPWRYLARESESVGEEESKVEQTVPPSVDLRLADAGSVGNTHLCCVLLAKIAPRAYLEFLREWHSIVLGAHAVVLED